jgi:signal transduction histidine kinase
MAVRDGALHEAARKKVHELRQPLNVIGLASGMLRVRILPLLDPAAAAYMIAKLDRIEEEVGRADVLAEQLVASVSPES